MEEDIEILEKLINVYKELKKDFEEGHASSYEMQFKDFKAIENLLTRYKQLEEENKKLIAQKTAINNKRKELEEELERFRTGKYISLKVNELYIPKSKVKEQIKWLDNDIKNTKNKLEQGKRPYPNYISEHRRLRMKAFITKSKEIKERLQNLIREE